MKRKIGVATAVVIASCLPLSIAASGFAQEKQQTKVKRGKYLVDFGGCHDCHSPKSFGPDGVPVLDQKRLLSGFPADTELPAMIKDALTPGNWVLFAPDLTAAVGPWGISYAANLTPDDQTGIGLWSEEHFVSAMRTGKHMGQGRPIMPPMPWFAVKGLTDDDLSAVFAYLKSLPPVKNQVPAPLPPDKVGQK